MPGWKSLSILWFGARHESEALWKKMRMKVSPSNINVKWIQKKEREFIIDGLYLRLSFGAWTCSNPERSRGEVRPYDLNFRTCLSVPWVGPDFPNVFLSLLAVVQRRDRRLLMISNTLSYSFQSSFIIDYCLSLGFMNQKYYYKDFYRLFHINFLYF